MTEILASELFCGIDEKAAEDIIGELGAYEREYAPGNGYFQTVTKRLRQALL